MQDLWKARGERISEELELLDRSQGWLARECDIQPSTVSRIIRGEHNPSDELKWKIAGALQIRMDRLWFWPQVVPDYPAPRRSPEKRAVTRSKAVAVRTKQVAAPRRAVKA